MTYKNPIPNLDDENASKKYSLVFTFETEVTHDEAVKGINDLIASNGGIIDKKWVLMGTPTILRKVGGSE